MKISYHGNKLVRVVDDAGRQYDLPGAYDKLQRRISHFCKFCAPRDAYHIAALLCIEDEYPTRDRTEEDQRVAAEVAQIHREIYS